MIKCRHSHLFLSFIAYLTILVADDRWLFTANCCFKLVFVATKVAHRAMTDMLSKGRERERDWWWWCASVNSTPQGKIQREREKEETHERISKDAFVCLSRQKRSLLLFLHILGPSSKSRIGHLKRKKDARQKEPTTFNIYLRVECFLLKLRRERWVFVTVVRTEIECRLKNSSKKRSKRRFFAILFALFFTLLLSRKKITRTNH